MTRSLLPVLLVLLPACEAFVCDFSRELEPGEVRGQIARENEDPAPFAVTALVNASRPGQAGADGAFSLRKLPEGVWFLRATDDLDGDGLVDQAAMATAVVAYLPHAVGYVGADDGQLTGVDFGTVGLAPTLRKDATVRVQVGDDEPVFADDLGYRALLAVVKTACVPGDGRSRDRASCVDGDDVENAARVLPLEAAAFAGPDGSVRLEGVLEGAATVIAIAAPFGAHGLDVVPAGVAVIPVDSLDEASLDDVVIPIAAPPDVDIVLEVYPSSNDEPYIVLAPRGVPAPPCSDTTPGSVDAPFVLRAVSAASGGTFQVAVPPGAFDLHACFGLDDEAVLFDVAVAPSDDLPVYGPLLRGAPLDCQGDDGRDCDDDGARGLPPLDPSSPSFADDQATWLACADDCTGGALDAPDTFGARARASCDVPAGVFDCDDDADGQPDVTESPACYGPFAGTDHDGDGRCSAADRFPRCAADVGCAGVDDFPPGVIDLVEGGGALCPTFAPGAVGADEACVLQGTGLARCATLVTRCYPRGCFVDEECPTDAVCRTVDDDTRCRPTCTLSPDSCASGASCTDGGALDNWCAPDDPDAAPDVVRCFCDDDSAAVGTAPSFVVDAVGGGCPESEGLWSTCVGAWTDAGTL